MISERNNYLVIRKGGTQQILDVHRLGAHDFNQAQWFMGAAKITNVNVLAFASADTHFQACVRLVKILA